MNQLNPQDTADLLDDLIDPVGPTAPTNQGKEDGPGNQSLVEHPQLGVLLYMDG